MLAARLAAFTSHRVIACARRPLDEIVLEGPEGGLRRRVPTTVDAHAMGPVEWVIRAVKAHQTAGAASWLRALCGPRTRLAILQNGVEHVERVEPHAGGVSLVPVVVDCPAETVPTPLNAAMAALLSAC